MSRRHRNKPFRHLKKLLREHNVPLEDLPAVRFPKSLPQNLSPQQEEALFREAMKDVRPLEGPKPAEIRPAPPPEGCRCNDDDKIMNRLQRLVDSGEGFRVADTPEYIEGKGDRVPDELVRRLHAGAFSVQAHIDLHGMRVVEAQAAVEGLLTRAVREGWQTVLIVHGRGLSSPGEPVLKSRLTHWLNRGTWRKWVLAYTSARICDGGAGATYVLLRRRPMTRRRRKVVPPNHRSH